jgi:hypothetical protein
VVSLLLIPIDLTNRRIEQVGEPFVATPVLGFFNFFDEKIDFALGIIFQVFKRIF